MKSTPSKLFIALVAVILCVIFTAFASWVAYEVYSRRDDRPLVRRAASWLPAAKVGSRKISYGDFLAARDTIRIYLSSSAAAASGLTGPLTSAMERSALDRLIHEAALQEAADERHVSVSDEEVQSSFNQLILSTSSSVPDVAGYLDKTFHWNEDQFRKNVIFPSLLESRVAETFASSTQDQQALLNAYIEQRLEKPDVKTYLKF